MTEFALVLAGDEAFANGLAVTIHSALRHLSSTADVYLLDNGLSQASLNRLRRVGSDADPARSLKVVRVSEGHLAHLSTPPHLTRATYARILIPDLLPADIRRVIYLDSDILVRRSLEPLFTIDLAGAPVAGVKDSGVSTAARLLRPDLEAWNSPPYFNSGVLVMDVPAWRESGLSERALKYLADHGSSLSFADQDALNAIAPRWHELDAVWNLQLWNLSLARSRLFTDRVGLAGDRARFRGARVLHFTGPKPWNPSCETRGTLWWVREFLRSAYLTPREGSLWLCGWLVRRARNRPALAARRMRARVGGLRRVVSPSQIV